MPCDEIYGNMIFSFTLFFKKTSTLFHVTGCFICIYVCILCRGQRRALNHQELEFQETVNYHVGAGNQTQFLWKIKQYSLPHLLLLKCFVLY